MIPEGFLCLLGNCCNVVSVIQEFCNSTKGVEVYDEESGVFVFMWGVDMYAVRV